jgi:hypothetical protein
MKKELLVLSMLFVSLFGWGQNDNIIPVQVKEKLQIRLLKNITI